MDGHDYSNLNEENACNILLTLNIISKEKVELVVVREGEKFTTILDKITLLE